MRIQVRDEQGSKILTFKVRDDGVLDSIEFLWDGLTLNFLADESGPVAMAERARTPMVWSAANEQTKQGAIEWRMI